MKKTASFNLILVLFLFFNLNGYSQETSESNSKYSPNFSAGIVLGHAHVFEGKNHEGEKSVMTLPLWGLEFNYQFHRKWALGLHTDIIIEKFVVIKDDGENIERSYPIAPAIMGIYKPNEHWSFLLGAGKEFSKEEDFILNRIGVEYAVELRNHWEVMANLGYDFLWNAYDSWSLGIGITKTFHGKKTD